MGTHSELEKEKKINKKVENRLKEIAKLEMPGEINKELRKLSKENNLTIQELVDQLKSVRKCMCISSVTTDTTDTTITTATTVTTNQPVAVVTCNTDIAGVFSDSLIDLVLKHFYDTKNTPITLDKLAKKISQNKDSVRATINRKKWILYS